MNDMLNAFLIGLAVLGGTLGAMIMLAHFQMLFTGLFLLFLIIMGILLCCGVGEMVRDFWEEWKEWRGQ